MPLINCEIELILTWSRYCVIINTNIANQNPTFTITETNLYVPVVTLSTHLIEPSFQGVSRLFVLTFENDEQRTSNRRYCFPNVEIKDYNVMIDGKIFFDQPINNMIKTYGYVYILEKLLSGR